MRRAVLVLLALLAVALPRSAAGDGCADTDNGGPKVYQGDPGLKQVSDRVEWVLYDPLLFTAGLRIGAESDLRQGVMELARNDRHTGYVTSIAAADFDEDGWVDLIGASDNTRRVTFFKNRTSENAAPAWYSDPLSARTPRFAGCEPGRPQSACSTWIADDMSLYAAVSTVAGDFNKDGHQDFYVAKICERCGFNEKPCQWRMYLGHGDGTFDAPYVPFADGDGGDEMGQLDWTGTTMQALDWDGDGDLDILVADSQSQPPTIRLLTNDGASPPKFASSTLPLTFPAGWTGSGAPEDVSRRGSTTVAAGFFDADANIDVIVGSVAHDTLLYFPGKRNKSFAAARDIQPGNVAWPLSAEAVLGIPWDSRGLDLIAVTDNWNYGCATTLCATDTKYGGYTDLLRRKDLFARNNSTTPPVRFQRWQTTHDDPHYTLGFHSVDWDSGAALDYDHDPEQMVDIMLAEGATDVSLYAMRNGYLYTGGQSAPIYPACSGDTNYTAWSPLVDPIADLGLAADSAVTSFCLTVDETLPAGTSIRYEMTNDNKVTSVQATCDAGGAGQRVCCGTFDLPGTKLRWRARLCPNAARSQTPVITRVSLGVAGEQRRVYAGAPVSSEKHKYIPGFAADGFDGRLFAFKIDATGDDTQLWEARDVLDAMADGSRKIYTATCSGSPCTWTTIEFSTANASDGALQSLLGAADTAEATAIINWTRSARFGIAGFPHKLGALLSATPAVLRPPPIPSWHDKTEISANEKSKIDTFRNAYTSRPRLVFAGAMDGMLHAFFTNPDDDSDAANGKEAWAFIPPDVAERLNDDRLSGTVTAYLDGSPLLADIPNPNSSNDYMTILASGLGSGGSSTFALDVTDTVDTNGAVTTAPRLLWSLSRGPAENWGDTRAPVTLVRRPPIDPVAVYSIAFATGRGAPGVDVGDTVMMVRASDGSTSSASWETELDPAGFNDADSPSTRPIFVETPATPLDYQDEGGALVTGGDGLTDFVVVGDSRGRVWKLRATDGAKLGTATADSGALGNILFATESSAGASGTEEPITGAISFFNDAGVPTLIFGTGGLGSASNAATFSIYLIDARDGTMLRRDTQAAGAKIFSGVLVTENGTCFVGTSTETKFSSSGTFFGECLSGTLARFECATGTSISNNALTGGVRTAIHAYEGVLAVSTSKGHVFTQGKPAEATATAGDCNGHVCVDARHWEEVF
jgi:PilC-like protein with beta-propeller domain/VCBS repeat protein